MDRMKTKDVQLMQASGDTMSTIDDWSTVMGTTPTTNDSSSQGTASQGANRPSWQGSCLPFSTSYLYISRRSPVDPQEWNHLYPQLCTNQQAHV